MSGHHEVRLNCVIKQSIVQSGSTWTNANSGGFWSYCKQFHEQISVMLRGWQENLLWEEHLKKEKKREPYAAVQTMAVPNILFQPFLTSKKQQERQQTKSVRMI